MRLAPVFGAQMGADQGNGGHQHRQVVGEAVVGGVEEKRGTVEQGRGILGVVDGFSPKGIEDEEGITWRKDFLRMIGYKIK